MTRIKRKQQVQPQRALVAVEPAKKTTYVEPPPCHTGNVPILTVGTGVLYIAGVRRGADFSQRVLVIDMTKEEWARPPAPIGGNWSGKKAMPVAAHEKYPWVNIPTPDFKTPTLGKGDWAKIAAQLKAYLESGQNAIVVCYGGHGRSGLAAAILMHFIDPQPGCPVTRLRDLYCKNAVETKEQLKYVERMTGVTVTATEPERWSVTPPVATSSADPKDWNYYRDRRNGSGGVKTFGADWTEIFTCEYCTTETTNPDRVCDYCRQPSDDRDTPRFK